MKQTHVHHTETFEYECNYCKRKYIPKRRRVQKYCSASCRSKAYHKSKMEKLNDSAQSIEEGLAGIKKDNSKPPANKIEKMSLAGAGNAAAGALAVNLITNAFTPEEKKPATKGDLSRIEEKLKRFHRVINYPPKHDGSLPYFDLETKKVIYSKNLFL